MPVQESAQSCGCDKGANWVCEWHRSLKYQYLGQPSPYSDKSAAGIGGISLPTDPVERKKYPIASGVLDYFPDAIAAIAYVSWVGNNQHHPNTPLHWDRSKSAD